MLKVALKYVLSPEMNSWESNRKSMVPFDCNYCAQNEVINTVMSIDVDVDDDDVIAAAAALVARLPFERLLPSYFEVVVNCDCISCYCNAV